MANPNSPNSSSAAEQRTQWDDLNSGLQGNNVEYPRQKGESLEAYIKRLNQIRGKKTEEANDYMDKLEDSLENVSALRDEMLENFEMQNTKRDTVDHEAIANEINHIESVEDKIRNTEGLREEILENIDMQQRANSDGNTRIDTTPPTLPNSNQQEPNWASLDDGWLNGEGDKSNSDEGIPPEWEGLNGQYLPSDKLDEMQKQFDRQNDKNYYESRRRGMEQERARREEQEQENPEDGKNKVEIGEVNIKKVEQEIAESKAERLKELEGSLEKILPNLAELYARNRRLIVGADNRAAFGKIQGEYRGLLDEYLKLKASETYERGKEEIGNNLDTRLQELQSDIEQKLLEFAGGDFENSEKTQEEIDAEKQRLQEEAEKQLTEEYKKMVAELEGRVNCEFIDDLLKQQLALEKATIDKLDNGTACRRFVNKVINSKALKGVLIGAAVAGLAVTGVGLAAGLAAGTASIGLGFTAGGVAAGASRGAFMGGLMSRQNSRNSAVRGFASEEDIRNNLEGINILNQDENTANVADYLMEQYNEANADDRSSNVKRTAISAGLGAIIGGLMSGVQINKAVNVNTSEQVQVGTEPTEYRATNLENINVKKGYGALDALEDLGLDVNDPEKVQRAMEIIYKHDPEFGMVPGSNGEVAGLNGAVGNYAHTYPGSISTWPDAAQGLWRAVSQELADIGDIPRSVVRSGGPVFETVTKVATEYVPNAFMNFITRATATVGAGAIGRIIGGAGRGNQESNRTAPERPTPPEPTPEASAPEPEASAPTPEAPTTESEVPGNGSGERQPTQEELRESLRRLEQELQAANQRAEEERARRERLAESIRNGEMPDLMR